jgi:hypothetical protein
MHAAVAYTFDASTITARHIWAGSPPPVTSFIGVAAEVLPSQTPAVKRSVKPTNHASRCPLVVPVLPAAQRPGFAARPPWRLLPRPGA